MPEWAVEIVIYSVLALVFWTFVYTGILIVAKQRECDSWSEAWSWLWEVQDDRR